MTVVALCIEPSSVDKGFTSGLADRLGLALHDLRHFELDIAARSDIADGKVPAVGRQRQGRALNWNMAREQLAARINEQVLEIVAADNALIIGWTVAPLVRHFEHVARVLIRAPTPFRYRTAMHEFAYPLLGTAEIEVDGTDSLIDRFMGRTFAADWRNPENFDLSFDAARVPASLQVELVRLLTGNARFHTTPAARAHVAAHLDDMRRQEAVLSDREDAATPSSPPRSRAGRQHRIVQ